MKGTIEVGTLDREIWSLVMPRIVGGRRLVYSHDRCWVGWDHQVESLI